MATERQSSAPMPSTPVGKQGAIPITTKVQPPSVATRISEDSIVYPHHLVFACIPQHTSVNSWKTGMPLNSRQSRVGEVAPSISNFRIFKDQRTRDAILKDYHIRFLGVSYEGCPDYKTAEKNSDTNGRFSVSISGKCTVFCDTRNLRNARIGDIIYAEPEPANFVWQDGHRNFHPPRLSSGPPNGVTHAGTTAIRNFISGDENFSAREFEIVFHNFEGSVNPSEFELVKKGIQSFEGHPLTKVQPKLTKDECKQVLKMFCEAPEEDIKLFLESVKDNDDIVSATYYICVGNMAHFEVFQTIICDTLDNKPIEIELIDGLSADDTSIKLHELAGSIRRTSRGYSVLGLMFAFGHVENLEEVLELKEPEGELEPTASSFSNRLHAIRTAAKVSASDEEGSTSPEDSSSSSRPAKRARTIATRVYNPSKFPIGTLVENGALSGRPNEISILLDARLGL